MSDAAPDEAVPESLEARLEEFTEVLLDIARGRFEATASRRFTGDPLDVLAFLVNATSQEVKRLVEDLRREREQLELAHARIVSSARLAALGQLAGGIAHELNQPLTAIQVIAEMLSGLDAAEIRPEDGIELIATAAKRMSRIVDGVRTFAREAELHMASASPTAALEAALALMREPLRSAGVELRITVQPGVPELSCDVDRLQQVFVNLLANARDAVVACADPTISVTVRRKDHDVVFAIEDNGVGVAVVDIDRLFEPFFTTKPPGRGMGLGLSISQGIVREHGGELTYEPNVPCGSRFSVRLPCAPREEDT